MSTYSQLRKKVLDKTFLPDHLYSSNIYAPYIDKLYEQLAYPKAAAKFSKYKFNYTTNIYCGKGECCIQLLDPVGNVADKYTWDYRAELYYIHDLISNCATEKEFVQGLTTFLFSKMRILVGHHKNSLLSPTYSAIASWLLYCHYTAKLTEELPCSITFNPPTSDGEYLFDIDTSTEKLQEWIFQRDNLKECYLFYFKN